MKILVVNGHPDPSPDRFVAALAAAYAQGARSAGHAVEEVAVGALDLPFLANDAEFATPAPDAIATVQAQVVAASHVVLVYPLWLGTMPAKLKAFLEHLARGEFLLRKGESAGSWPRRMMTGRSARLVVTMGMPGTIYKLLFRAHSLKALSDGVFWMSGFKPIRTTVFGRVEEAPGIRRTMLEEMTRLGREGR